MNGGRRRRVMRPPRSGRVLRLFTVAVVGVLVFLIWRALQYPAPEENTENAESSSENTASIVPSAVSSNANLAVAAKTTPDNRSNTNVADAGAEEPPAPVQPVTTSTPCTGVVSSFGADPNIALTFDAGAGTGSASEIADTLVETHTPATFFVTGTWVEQNRDLAVSIVKDGFALYNHTYSHPHPASISPDALTEELTKTSALIQNAGGADPRPFFRPPYGEYDDATIATAKKEGYCLVTWTVDALDWQEGATSDASLQRVLARAKNGAIVLMHVGDDVVPKFLPDLIAELRTRGYTLVSLADLMQIK